MKNWVPFNDYDFYAYLTAGMIVLFALDYALNDGAIMLRETWPFIQIVFVVALAYLVGHIVGGIASVVLEQLARCVLRPPVAVMLNIGTAPVGEQFIGRWVVGRYYDPVSENIRSIILTKVANKLCKEQDDITDPEEVFQIALHVARTLASTATRIDTFRNLYGFSRNAALSGLIGTGALVYRAAATNESSLYWWAVVVLIFSFALFGRFLKFYAAYHAEVLHTYAFGGEEE